MAESKGNLKSAMRRADNPPPPVPHCRAPFPSPGSPVPSPEVSLQPSVLLLLPLEFAIPQSLNSQSLQPSLCPPLPCAVPESRVPSPVSQGASPEPRVAGLCLQPTADTGPPQNVIVLSTACPTCLLRRSGPMATKAESSCRGERRRVPPQRPTCGNLAYCRPGVAMWVMPPLLA